MPKGRKKFAQSEAAEICRLSALTRRAERSKQMLLRERISKTGIYITDFDESRAGFGPEDFDRLVSRGVIEVNSSF